jgi:hypothetical protein
MSTLSRLSRPGPSGLIERGGSLLRGFVATISKLYHFGAPASAGEFARGWARGPARGRRCRELERGSAPCYPRPGWGIAAETPVNGRAGAFSGRLAAGLWSLAAPAHAADKSIVTKVKAIDQGRRGTTITLALDNGMFPAPGSRYRDATTIVFVPNHFRVLDDQKVDAVVHFHGHRTTAADSMVKHQLREQLDDSRQNAILVMPQGPVRRSDSSGGNLDKPGGFQSVPRRGAHGVAVRQGGRGARAVARPRRPRGSGWSASRPTRAGSG